MFWDNRNNAVKHFQLLFNYDHLPTHLQSVSKPFSDLAEKLVVTLNDGPELTVALRKLLEAKDCAVRQLVIDKLSES